MFDTAKFLSVVPADRKARAEKAIADLVVALFEKKIYNVHLQELKLTLDRSAEEGWKAATQSPEFSEAIRAAGWESALRKLTWDVRLNYVRDAIACSKKLAKTKVESPLVDAMRAFVDAVLPTAMALEAVKAFIVKGRVPSEKVIARTGREGTCPVCFGEYQTRGANFLVKHGFQRPGCGYLIGECFGVDYPAFEKSTAGTKAFITHLQDMLATNLADQVSLRQGKVESLAWGYTAAVLNADGSPVRDHYGRRQTREVVIIVKKDAPRSTQLRVDADSEGPRGRGLNSNHVEVPSFEDLAGCELANLESTEKSLEGDIARLEDLVRTWTPGWKRPVGW
jgi:hypothetical protein